MNLFLISLLIYWLATNRVGLLNATGDNDPLNDEMDDSTGICGAFSSQETDNYWSENF